MCEGIASVFDDPVIGILKHARDPLAGRLRQATEVLGPQGLDSWQAVAPEIDARMSDTKFRCAEIHGGLRCHGRPAGMRHIDGNVAMVVEIASVAVERVVVNVNEPMKPIGGQLRPT
jgi:hypothetical protein